MKRMNLIFMILLCLCSCKNSKEKEMIRLVTEWTGKEIIFPSQSIFTIQGKDTVDFNTYDSDYKVLMYVDSIGCTNCKLNLPYWKMFIEEIDSIAGRNIPFLFYFYPKNVKELRYITRRDNFIYPVCFDLKDELNTLNHFPKIMDFQTFLLDKDNKVKVIGNPVQNPNIRDLYFSQLSEIVRTEKKVVNTKVKVDRMMIDFETFPLSKEQESEFCITNTGSQLLVLQDVITSCGCIRVEYSKKPVCPGDTLKLKLIYKAEEKEFF